MYANFRDPWGLLLRMVRSGDRAAYGTLMRAGATALLTPIDRLLESAETRRRLAARPTVRLPVLLIVGAPRSGTTLVAQVLAHHLPFTFFTNLSALFPRAPLTASLLFGRLLRSPPTDFDSYYGNTAGIGGINDGFHIWNRWLGSDRYHAPDTLTGAAAADMRLFFAAWTEAFRQPLLNKNNRNTDCIALLADALPTAQFVVVRRNPKHVAQSLLLARERIQGHKAHKWSVRSTDQDPSAGPMGYVDSVCGQIFEIETRVRAALGTLASDRYLEVRYEQFCEKPATTIQTVAGRASVIPIKMSGSLEGRALTGRSSSWRDLTSEELERIDRLLEAYGSRLTGGWGAG